MAVSEDNQSGCDSVWIDQVTVDAIVPCYNEAAERLHFTIAGCFSQSRALRNVIVVDDASSLPVELPGNDARVRMVRLPENSGIAAARNAGARESDASLLLFLNVDVGLAPDWLSLVVRVMQCDPSIGACCGRIRPLKSTLMSRWRMRFQEEPYERTSGTHEIRFATGHAVLIRREAFDAVKGYDPRFGSSGEDGDICLRMRDVGYRTVVVGGAGSVSRQIDEPWLLAKKQLRHSGWANRSGSFIDTRPIRAVPASWCTLKSLMTGMCRNIARLRLDFLPVDFIVFGYALHIVWAPKFQFLAIRWFRPQTSAGLAH